MKTKPEHILILGGGTAGWLSAIMLSHVWQGENIAISLVESPEVATIGVGEGSTPALMKLFKRLGFPEDEWMPECNATYKCGIEFVGWSGRPGYESYFHPFASELDKYTMPFFMYSAQAKLAGMDIAVRPADFFLSGYLSKNACAPKSFDNSSPALLYGYHFDAHLLGQYLAKKAISLGVRHRREHIAQVLQNEQGDINAVRTKSGEELAADFFIDCTGFASLLFKKTLKTSSVSYESQLFNNAAVTLQSPIDTKIPSQTLSTALRSGWAWKIPLTNRVGNGYVYSKNFCSADEAEYELRAHLGMLNSEVTSRHLSMNVGRLEKHWQRNCLAVGLSQGFIEPLEATALYLVQQTIDLFVEAVGKGSFSSQHRDVFNAEINAYFDGVRDYVVTHYKISRRNDSPYWRANTATTTDLSSELKALYAAWRAGRNLSDCIAELAIDRYYPAPSWYCIFVGMGFWGNTLHRQAATPQLLQDVNKIRETLTASVEKFAEHKSYLQHQVNVNSRYGSPGNVNLQ